MDQYDRDLEWDYEQLAVAVSRGIETVQLHTGLRYRVCVKCNGTGARAGAVAFVEDVMCPGCGGRGHERIALEDLY